MTRANSAGVAHRGEDADAREIGQLGSGAGFLSTPTHNPFQAEHSGSDTARAVIPAIDIFRERCSARAVLVEACVYDLLDAVDGLQADAVRTGLADEIGQDAVQKVMAEAFRREQKPSESMGDHTIVRPPESYRLVSQDGVAPASELQRDYEAALRRRRKQYGAAPTTVEALMYSLRERGEHALAEPNCQRRLSELSPDQLRQVIVRLDRMRAKYPAVTDELLLRVGEKIP